MFDELKHIDLIVVAGLDVGIRLRGYDKDEIQVG